MSPLAPRRRRPGRKGERGVALIIAVVAITLLTVVATDFAYNTRVDLQLATNQRDELRAHYLASSGIGMSRLLLRFQKQLNSVQLPSIPIPGMPAGGGLNLQIWKMARVDCQMLQGMVQSNENGPREELAPQNVVSGFDEEFPEVANKQRLKSFGGFEGCFLATIQDEEAKLNVLRLSSTSAEARSTTNRLLELLSDRNYEFLFERADSNGVKVTPQDLVIALKDWADEDESQSALNTDPTAPTPFATGFAGETNGYDSYEPRYKPKNGRYDSLEELYRVHGVNDRFMAAFRDRLTVYPTPSRGLNVNTDDTAVLIAAILSTVRNPQVLLQKPVALQEIIDAVKLARQFSVMGMSVKDFVQVVSAIAPRHGAQMDPRLANAQPSSSDLSDKSETFRITSVGEAGSVQKTIHAVVRLDDSLGKLLYWREE